MCVDNNFTFDADFLLSLSSISFLLDKVLKGCFIFIDGLKTHS